MSNGTLSRILGGPPQKVIIKLVFLSILAGAVMAMFDVTPFDLIDTLRHFFERLFSGRLEILREFGRYLVYGGAVILPIWAVLRLFGAMK